MNAVVKWPALIPGMRAAVTVARACRLEDVCVLVNRLHISLCIHLTSRGYTR